MNPTEIVRDIMNRKKIKPSELATMLNIKNNTMLERLGQKNVSVNKLMEMLEPLGYSVQIVPKDTDVPDDGYLIGEEKVKPTMPDLDKIIPQNPAKTKKDNPLMKDGKIQLV